MIVLMVTISVIAKSSERHKIFLFLIVFLWPRSSYPSSLHLKKLQAELRYSSPIDHCFFFTIYHVEVGQATNLLRFTSISITVLD
jgi:hypothetical protein